MHRFTSRLRERSEKSATNSRYTSSVQHVEKEVVNAFKYDAKYVFEDARNITKSETGERVEKLSQALENCIKALESN